MRRGPGRPPLPEGEKRVHFGVRLRPWLRDALKVEARRRSLTQTEAVEEALIDWLAKRPNGHHDDERRAA